MKKLIIWIILISLFINITNANYERNIDDDFKIYKLEQKIWKILDRSNSKELLKSKLIYKVKSILWKTEKELNSVGNFKNYNINSFKEYFFIKIYRYLSYWDLIQYKDSKIEILENDIFRVLVTLPNKKIDNTSVYYIWKSWNKRKYIEIFEINKNENVLDFLNKNILEEKYTGKCQSYITPEHNISFTNNIVYRIWAYWDYKSTTRNVSDCWEYWEWYWINYFERRGDYLMYINAWQDYNWVDFSLIEFK